MDVALASSRSLNKMPAESTSERSAKPGPRSETKDSEFKKTIQTFGFFINLGRLLLLCPYRFDAKTDQIVVEKSRWYRIGAFTGAALLFLYDSFLVVQCVRLPFNDQVPLAYKIRTYYITTVFLFWSTGIPLALMQFGSYGALFNELMDMGKQVGALHDFKRGSKGMKWVFRALVFLFLYGLAIFPRDLLKKPDMPLLLTSMLDKENTAWRKHLVAIWVLHTYFGWVVFYNAFLTTMLLLLFVSTATPTVEVLRLGSEIKLRLTPRSLRIIFGRLAVLERVYTSMLGPWTLQLVVTHILYVIICCYQWFMFRSTLTGICGILIFVVLANFTKKCGGLFEQNTEVMRTWAPLEGDLAFKKWKRACRPIRVTIGSFFHFDRRVLLTFIEIIVVNSVNLILSN